ncbi:MAG: hypothetical protein OXN89_22920 [Bryobacterales bacterium]|nr:hypothetical protein [Bryobacterales bacterium]
MMLGLIVQVPELGALFFAHETSGVRGPVPVYGQERVGPGCASSYEPQRLDHDCL